MLFEFSDDQQTAATAIDHMLAPYRTPPVNAEPYLYSEELDRELTRSGFHAVGQDEDLGGIAAAHLVMEVAKLPFCVEIMASTLIHPVACPDLPRPLALVHGRGPTRFAAVAKTAVVDDGETMRLVAVDPSAVTPAEGLLAYPFGTIDLGALGAGERVPDDKAEAVRRWWLVGLAAEISGAIDGALALTKDHVSQREQFGKPLGANQAVQHRLAEVAVTAESLRWLVYRAASSDDGVSAAVAAAYAQNAIARVTYDLHQFSGAMGLTLEYPLHLWTYRLRALVSELGGPARQAQSVADLTWGEPDAADADR